MFGKRGASDDVKSAPRPAEPASTAAADMTPAAVMERVATTKPNAAPNSGEGSAPAASIMPSALSTSEEEVARVAVDSRSDEYYEVKTMIFSALIDTIDLAQLAQLDVDSAREEIRDIVNEIITIKSVVMSIAEQEQLLTDICNDVLGYGPLEPLLARDDIADIMVNGAGRVFIEVNGKVQLTNVRFRDNGQLMNICQRIVSQVGRRVDKSSPICDARLPDGSRVNVIAPPLALDGPTLTIRKFKKDKLKLEDLTRFGSITPEGAKILGIIGRCRCNVIISGGTGSGKTTLLNCLTAFIDSANVSSPAKMRQNFNSSSRMLFVWKRVRPTLRAKARLRCETWSEIVCVCVRNGLSSARCADPKRLTYYKP